MALGFGFNKAKVLASAEKFVQQGKLQNAIAEYEKIVKEDPKDLTVLNTLGDLCVRVGQNDEAAQHFRKVGDHYAQDGFTVKAIAVYKKLTRLSPNNYEIINRLADLYSQQGLASDARAQYMQVADQLLKAGDNAQAARAFQRILELDPENTNTQAKLADLYIKLGKKAEACKIFYSAAESLYHRSSFDAAEEALAKVLSIDPENGPALLLRGMIAADAGDSKAAVQHLQRVSDLDSRPDGLRALLRAKLQAKTIDGAEAVATKLASVHNDVSGISAVAQWYASNHQIGRALNLYETYCDRFVAADRPAFEQAIYPLINHVREDPDALDAMSRVLQKMGDSSHNAEITEFQAHAFAQKGDYKAARDLYKKLAELEPDNPLHAQNYKQMLSKLGEDPTTRALSPSQASQAFMMEELEQGAPAVHQTYDAPTERAIEAALTDAELFVSYNVPGKAIPPLEAVLPLAPRDVTVNQRLATLYARSGRHADAARTCQLLSDVYRELGHETEASRYLEASRNYASRVAPAPAVAPVPAPQPRQPAAAPEPPVAATAVPVHDVVSGGDHQPALQVDIPAEQPGSSVQEFSFDVPDHLFIETEPAPPPPVAQPTPVVETHVVSAPEPKAPPAAAEPELDVSSEWEDMLTVESAEPQSAEVEAAPVSAAKEPEAATTPDPAIAAAEKIQEAQLYISQQMWDAAKKAILDLTEIAPDAHEVSDLISAVSAGQARAAAASAPAPSAPAPPPAKPAAVVSAPLAVKPAAQVAPPPPAEEFEVEVEPPQAPVEEFLIAAEPEPSPAEEPVIEKASEPPPPPPPPAPKKAAALALEEIFRSPTVPVAPAPAAPVAAPAPPAPSRPASRPKPQPSSVPAAAAEIFAPPPLPAPAPAAAASAVPMPAPRRPAPPPAPVAPVVSAAAAQAVSLAASPALSPALSEVALEEPVLEDLVVPVEIEALEIERPPLPVSIPAAAPPATAVAKVPPVIPQPATAVASAPAAAPPPAMAPPAPLPPAVSSSVAAPAVDDLLEDILDVEIPPAPTSRTAAPSQTKAQPSKPKEPTTEDILTDFVSDMEQSDLADFNPRAKPDAPRAPEPVLKAAPLELEEEAAILDEEEEAVLTPPPRALEAPASALSVPVDTVPSAAAAAEAPVNGDMRDAESASVLTDILAELQHETVEESETQEDPEVHYNLGIAFKEMGLLDEAIGELQKVCHAMDRGSTFSQPIQAYTWLAQCLVDKGAPEAAVRWYKRALQLPRLDDGSRCAIYYDLALAYEAFGDKKSALANLMEVYGSNIDFRDVASRIKALKS